MVHVAARRVQPQVVGLAYCSMIELCRGWYDIARAREWTEALTGWVDEQQGMVPYRGACLVHRAEFLQLRGEWAAAVSQADEACRRLALISAHAAGPAHYRAFERAAAAGHEVQPGLARLRLAQARPEAALGGLDRAIAERRDPRTAPELLSARVDVCLVRGDLAGATETLHRLTGSVGDDATPYVRAMVDFAVGSVRCAGGSWSEALPRLRAAGEAWAALDARYEAAVARLALGRCCTALGDEDAGAMETAAARTALVALGVDAVVDDCPLTAREVEVLRILATGATNRSIASSLVLSEKTVARHVSNIFTKLGVGSRSAATARAFERHWA
jgi:DNA-binding CsgD family transcriptional regulator